MRRYMLLSLVVLLLVAIILGVEIPDPKGPFAKPPDRTTAFDRVKFEVDFIKYLATMCAAAVAFISGYLKNQEDKPPAWMTGYALASFIVAACMCSLGYMLKTYEVIQQSKPLWHLYLDRTLGVVTDLAFIIGIGLTLAMCFRPLWSTPKTDGKQDEQVLSQNQALQQTDHAKDRVPSSADPPA